MGSIRVGKAQARHDTPAHVRGTHQGNTGPFDSQQGHHKDGTADARRSTGVHWKKHDTILKIMPNLSPG